MDNIKQYKDSRIGMCDSGAIYIQGNYLEWYNENEDCLKNTAPIEFTNLSIMEIDEDGMYLEKMLGWKIEVDGEYLDQNILDKS